MAGPKSKAELDREASEKIARAAAEKVVEVAKLLSPLSPAVRERVLLAGCALFGVRPRLEERD